MPSRGIDFKASEHMSVAKHSYQGLNVAFIGLDHASKTACAEYLRRVLGFKRMELREPLVHFLRTSYGYHSHFKMGTHDIIPFYDAIYKLDNTLFVNHFIKRFSNTTRDVVVSDIRYLNELKALKEQDFIIIRVTSPIRSKIGAKIKTADKDTVILSMLYDKNFAVNYNVEYNVNYTSVSNVAYLLNPILEEKGYKFDIT